MGLVGGLGSVKNGFKNSIHKMVFQMMATNYGALKGKGGVCFQIVINYVISFLAVA